LFDDCCQQVAVILVGAFPMKNLITFLVLCGAPMWAWSIPLADVGSIDTFMASTVLSDSSEAGELSWIASEIGSDPADIVLVFKDDDPAVGDWLLVDGYTDVYAYQLASPAAYYLLKLGVGQSGADTHYLFDNLVDLSWAVVNFADALDGQPVDFNLGRISHITATVVPESSTLMLMGFGLLGFAATKRIKRKA
jgi:hypothetical protein